VGGTSAYRKNIDMKKINKIIMIIFINFLFNINYLYSKNTNELYEKIDLFSEVLETIKKEYVNEVDQAEVMDSAINGILQSLDPYSSYMSPKSFQGMQTDTKGEFGGLGIEIGMESGVVKVIAPIDDTPASNAGIKSGDYIVKINNEQVQGKSLTEAVELMRGPVGSEINLTVRRRNVKKALDFKIKRAVIEVKSVNAKIVGERKKIGYLKLKSFNENSYNQLSKKINKFEKNNKLNGYILDLRNNPGGLLTQAINITDFFLDNGEIVSTKGRKISETRRFFSRKGDGIDGKPLIVIINNGSASASEIVAGALKDHKRAIILGENTYGKGSVQSIIPLKNGGGIRLTISKYYLPSGKSISEVGVLPDIFVEEAGDDFKINSKTDNQLKYAVNLLKS
jgi:carboxyl-terminal processing protease